MKRLLKKQIWRVSVEVGKRSRRKNEYVQSRIVQTFLVVPEKTEQKKVRDEIINSVGPGYVILAGPEIKIVSRSIYILE